MSTPVSSRPVVGLFTFPLVAVLAAGCGLFGGSMDAETAAVVKVGQFPATIDPTWLQRVADLLVSYGMPGERVAMEPLVIPVPSATG